MDVRIILAKDVFALPIMALQFADISSSCIILADLCDVVLGLRRSEFFASAEKCPNRTCGYRSKVWDIAAWAERLPLDEIIKVRLCYAKHYRHRVTHEIIAGLG